MKLRFLALAALSLLFVSCIEQKQEGVSLVNPALFEQQSQASDVQLVDVRTPEEYAEGHLPNAVNMNISDASFDAKIATLDKTKPVMVYCKMGGRSAKAAAKLKEAGFTTITDLEGGIVNWKSEDKPIEN
jgi:rhodanese-related sulfurtransferase